MIAGVQIETWQDDCEEEIAAFVCNTPDGLIYYAPAFRRYLLEILPRARCRSLLARRGRELVGILPLLECEGPYGKVMNSLPFFGSNGGILGSDKDAVSALRTTYELFAREPGVAASTWVAHPFIDVDPPTHDIEDERISQWTVLSPDNNLPDGVEPSARRNVRKSSAAGVTVSETPDALGFLEEIHKQNMQAIGGRPKPSQFFTELPRSMKYGSDWRLYVANRNGEELAAVLTFEAGRNVEYVMPAIKPDARALQPTSAILAYAMRSAAERGMRRWNWGATWLTQTNVYRFKRKWGASERRYKYYISVSNPELMEASTADLLAAYPYFFTLPFDRLKNQEAK